MAYQKAGNWINSLGGSALSGAGLGASLGGPIGALIGGIGGLGLGALQGIFGEDQPQQYMNPYADRMFQTLSSDKANYENLIKEYLGKAQPYQNKASGLIDRVSNFDSNAQFDPEAAMRQFMSYSPAYQKIAQGVAKGPFATNDINSLTDQAKRAAISGLGVGDRGSGAALKTITQAMSMPRFQYAQGQNQTYANALMNLLSGSQTQTANNAIMTYQAQRQREQDMLNALLQGYQGNMGIANAERGTAGLYGTLLGHTVGGLSGLASGGFPGEIVQPATDNAVTNILSSAGNLFGSDAFKKGLNNGQPSQGENNSKNFWMDFNNRMASDPFGFGPNPGIHIPSLQPQPYY